MSRIVHAVAVDCSVGFLIVRYHHLDDALRSLLRIGNSEVYFVNSSVTFAGAFGTKVHVVIIGSVGVMDNRVGWRVAIAEPVGRLVLSNTSDGDVVVTWLNDTQDLHRKHLVIRRPEHRH